MATPYGLYGGIERPKWLIENTGLFKHLDPFMTELELL